jgi:hypothetical protein
VALIVSVGYVDPQLDVSRLNPLLEIVRMPGQKPGGESLPEAGRTYLSGMAQTLGQWTGRAGDRSAVAGEGELMNAQQLIPRCSPDRGLPRKDPQESKAVHVVDA